MTDKLITIPDVCALTGVTHMTVYNWRIGGRDKTKLPCVLQRAGTRSRVRFKLPALVKWADKNGVPIDKRQLKKIESKK